MAHFTGEEYKLSAGLCTGVSKVKANMSVALNQFRCIRCTFGHQFVSALAAADPVLWQGQAFQVWVRRLDRR